MANYLRSKFYYNLIELLNKDFTNSDVNNYLNNLNGNEIVEYSNNLNIINNLEWANTKVKPNLKNHIILYDFWTYCCINCMHVIPLIKKLEQDFPELIVIGVHSAKFTNEKSKKNIEHAARRHLLKHPVVCDNDLDLWTKLEINCWPTFLLTNPQGLIIGEFQGETQANLVQKFLPFVFEFYRDKLESQIDFQVIDNPRSNTINTLNELYFPTKLCLNPNDSILFVSDTGNNRILGIDLISNKIKYAIGCGIEGYRDDSVLESQFSSPQGLAFDEEENYIYVADTGNSLIRKIDLTNLKVTTLCGKYDKNVLGIYDYTGGKQSLEQSISSPWDLCITKRDKQKFLIVACAGSHQLWIYPLKVYSDSQKFSWWRNIVIEKDTLLCIVGNGKERNRNNSYPLQASLAQPSGLCSDEENIYVADAESSTIRKISLKDGCVKNVVGGDNSQPDNLFVYGDVDGIGTKARLQHPMDVKLFNNGESLLIADAYNNKIKIVDLKTNMCKELNSFDDKLSEPNGICVDNERGLVYVCDTNNHSIKIIDSTKNSISILCIEILDHFKSKFESIDINSNSDYDDLVFRFNFKINLQANNTWSLKVYCKNKEAPLEVNGQIEKKNRIDEDSFKVHSMQIGSIKKIIADICVFYCEYVNENELCKMLKIQSEINLENLKNNIFQYDESKKKAFINFFI